MPRYEYGCPKCKGAITIRRVISEMDDPIESLCCGQPMQRQFNPSANIFIPTSFRQVLTGGAPGGGGLSWSDFHDKSEREMAHDPNVISYAEAMSKPGMGSKSTTNKGVSMGEAYMEAKERHGVR